MRRLLALSCRPGVVIWVDTPAMDQFVSQVDTSMCMYMYLSVPTYSYYLTGCTFACVRVYVCECVCARECMRVC